MTLSSILMSPKKDCPLIVTDVLKSQGAPVTWTEFVPFSSYSIRESLSLPSARYVSSGITISPVPFGSRIISPSVSVDDNVFVSSLKLSIFH